MDRYRRLEYIAAILYANTSVHTRNPHATAVYDALKIVGLVRLYEHMYEDNIVNETEALEFFRQLAISREEDNDGNS